MYHLQGDTRRACRVLWGNLRERNHLEGLGAGEKIICKIAIEEIRWVMDWSDMALDRCKRQTLVSEVSGSIKCWKFLN